MSMTNQIFDDLTEHAIAKTFRVMRDATGLLDRPEDQLGITLLMACSCIGYAAGFLVIAAERKGCVLDKEDAFREIIDMVKAHSGSSA